MLASTLYRKHSSLPPASSLWRAYEVSSVSSPITWRDLWHSVPLMDFEEASNDNELRTWGKRTVALAISVRSGETIHEPSAEAVALVARVAQRVVSELWTEADGNEALFLRKVIVWCHDHLFF